jgi:hypothetical protein
MVVTAVVALVVAVRSMPDVRLGHEIEDRTTVSGAA